MATACWRFAWMSTAGRWSDGLAAIWWWPTRWTGLASWWTGLASWWRWSSSLLDHIDLILVLVLVLEVLVLLVLQAYLHHRPWVRMIPINVKVWDHTVMVGMW